MPGLCTLNILMTHADTVSQGPSAPRRATIEDVARVAGVSKSAVSKVIRQSSGVSTEMRERVTAAIALLGYRPNAGARSLRGRSYTIGVVVIDLASPFQPEIAQGISTELEASPYQEVLVAAGIDPDRQQRSIEALIDRQVDGLILVAPWTSSAWLEELASKVPTVIVARHGQAQHFDSVVDDDHEGARLMVDHLVELGHERIVHTSQSAGGLHRPNILSHTARLDGYEDAMRRHGLQPDVITTSYSEEGGYQAALEALSRPIPPTAIFAGADIAALGVLRAAEELGVSVPDDLSVSGYDNTFISGIGRISLTTVDQSGHRTGATSARLLLERIEGRSRPVHYVIGPRLVSRNTTAPPRVGTAR
jgi:LacI family transcriptional regulator